MISAQIVADSIAEHGVRITTLSLVFPRFILAEFNTHRMLSRNSASSRAIPTKKIIQEVMNDPAMPMSWQKNIKGMQGGDKLPECDVSFIKEEWLAARDAAAIRAQRMADAGLAKQTVNRILEPYMHSRTVVTATEWDNFFALRRHKDAQPEFKILADAMFHVMHESTPKFLLRNQWHLPYAEPDTDNLALALDQSVARSARVSYNLHDGRKTTDEEDSRLAVRLSESGHWSPFEHQALACGFQTRGNRYNNFRCWKQHRYLREHRPASFFERGLEAFHDFDSESD